MVKNRCNRCRKWYEEDHKFHSYVCLLCTKGISKRNKERYRRQLENET